MSGLLDRLGVRCTSPRCTDLNEWFCRLKAFTPVMLCFAAGALVMSLKGLLLVAPCPDTCCVMLAEQLGLQIIAVHMAC